MMGPYREGHGEAPKLRWWGARAYIKAREGFVGTFEWLPMVFALGLAIGFPISLVHGCRMYGMEHKARCAQVCRGNAAKYLDDSYTSPSSCTCLRGAEIIRFDAQWERQEPDLGELSPTREPCPPTVAP